MKSFLRISVCLLLLFVGHTTFGQNAEKTDPNKKDGGTEYYHLPTMTNVFPLRIFLSFVDIPTTVRGNFWM
ncbi:hypothetical protein LEP1GSC012_1008 [Leptospira interrogans serovar Valbuzzi str. Valbuzzi]|nr:hypothetical protein LEP1GSC012_1008 [Leptospira interrogans serovar Valbuzzi str. Valbuzzi]